MVRVEISLIQGDPAHFALAFVAVECVAAIHVILKVALLLQSDGEDCLLLQDRSEHAQV